MRSHGSQKEWVNLSIREASPLKISMALNRALNVIDRAASSPEFLFCGFDTYELQMFMISTLKPLLTPLK